jgi:hypothetical protein
MLAGSAATAEPSLTGENAKELERLLAIPAENKAVDFNFKKPPRIPASTLDRYFMWNEIALDTTEHGFGPHRLSSGRRRQFENCTSGQRRVSTLRCAVKRAVAVEDHYSAEGWRVFAACRNPDAASKLRCLAQDTGGMLNVIAMDVTDAQSVRNAATQLKDVAIDVLINSAGIAGASGQKTGNVDYQSRAHVLDVKTSRSVADSQQKRRFADTSLKRQTETDMLLAPMSRTLVRKFHRLPAPTGHHRCRYCG